MVLPTPFANVLACQRCAGSDIGVGSPGADPQSEGAAFECRSCGHKLPLTKGVLRAVPAENYASSFGFQWNQFAKAQLDSQTGTSITADRFYAQSGWTPNALEKRLVLDVGCGSGRFAEVALAAGAYVVAVDYSSAAEACAANLGGSPNLLVIQGDARKLPLRPGSFDFVYCFGVLQHTPNPAETFAAIARMVRPGGSIAVDVYRKHWTNWLYPKYIFRPITTRMDQVALLRWVRVAVKLFLPFARLMAAVPLIGRYLRRLSPVACYYSVLPLSPQDQVTWSILDTFDWYSPAYDRPQTADTLRAWFERAGMQNVEVHHPAHLSCRGTRAVETARPQDKP